MGVRTRWLRRLAWTLVLPAVMAVAAETATQTTQATQATQKDPHEEALIARKITPDLPGITAYLRTVQELYGRPQAIQDLIRQLGDKSWQAREDATARLVEMPILPEELLQEATKSPDAEISARAELVLRTAKGRGTGDVLIAAFRVLRTKRLQGAAGDILKVLPYCQSRWMLSAATDALAATSRQEDLPLLRESLRSATPAVREAAATALAAMTGEKAADDLKGLLEDKDGQVALAAARGLAYLGRRECLATLGALLSSQDVAVRAGADGILRALTGQAFNFSPHEEAAKREAAAQQWREWIARSGPDAKLRFPLQERTELGRTIFCVGRQGKPCIVELDPEGKEVSQIQTGQSPWGIQVLTNGNRLVACYGTQSAHEYDATGKEVWKCQNLPGGPMNIFRLPNGNTLMACSDADVVVEVNPQGAVVWQVAVQGRPAYAQRLPDGKTLVAAHRANRIIEIDKDGQELWAVENLNDPQVAIRLDSGSTLVVLTGDGKVVELDRSGKVLWSCQGFQTPLDAQRLSNGNTLVTDQKGLYEVDPAGKIVWQREETFPSRAQRF